MKTISTKIPGLLIIEPQVFYDDRGFFYESFNSSKWESDLGLKTNFVQDNHSRSKQNVLRGLHYQVEHPQGKLVRAVVGEVFDVAVDIRLNSSSFGKWVGVKLSADNKRQFWIPEGFAHGFLALSHTVELLYKTTDYWYPQCERTLLWNDPDIAIEWPIECEPLLSQKDLAAHPLKSLEKM